MLDKVISAMLILVGIFTLLPVSGALGADRLAALYGILVEDPNLAILMRHRAILFGLLGLFIIYAAFHREIQVLGRIAGFVSVISFLYLVWETGVHNANISKIVIVDIVALVCLTITAGLSAFR